MSSPRRGPFRIQPTRARHRRLRRGVACSGSLAQQAEQRAFNPLVQGSSPWRPTQQGGAGTRRRAGTIRAMPPEAATTSEGRVGVVADGTPMVRAGIACHACGPGGSRSRPRPARPPRWRSSSPRTTRCSWSSGRWRTSRSVELVRRLRRRTRAAPGRVALIGRVEPRRDRRAAEPQRRGSRPPVDRRRPSSSTWSRRVLAGERVVDPGRPAGRHDPRRRARRAERAHRTRA